MAETLDAGGQPAASASYSHAGSLGSLGGVSEAAAPTVAAHHGYLNQLNGIKAVTLTANPTNLNEGQTRQVIASVQLDDDSVLSTPAADFTWEVREGPVHFGNDAGLLAAEIIYQSEPARISGSYQGYAGFLDLLVLDADPDNFGSYAGDGLRDDWQAYYFGLNNPAAGPNLDPDQDQQNNEFEAVAGLIPTNAASRFELTIENVAANPQHRAIVFQPRLGDRIYTVDYRLDLTEDSFVPLDDTAVSDDGDVRTIVDLSATNAFRFYRVNISLQP